jgi:hypothetical protein
VLFEQAIEGEDIVIEGIEIKGKQIQEEQSGIRKAN